MIPLLQGPQTPTVIPGSVPPKDAPAAPQENAFAKLLAAEEGADRAKGEGEDVLVPGDVNLDLIAENAEELTVPNDAPEIDTKAPVPAPQADSEVDIAPIAVADATPPRVQSDSTESAPLAADPRHRPPLSEQVTPAETVAKSVPPAASERQTPSSQAIPAGVTTIPRETGAPVLAPPPGTQTSANLAAPQVEKPSIPSPAEQSVVTRRIPPLTDVPVTSNTQAPPASGATPPAPQASPLPLQAADVANAVARANPAAPPTQPLPLTGPPPALMDLARNSALAQAPSASPPAIQAREAPIRTPTDRTLSDTRQTAKTYSFVAQSPPAYTKTPTQPEAFQLPQADLPAPSLRSDSGPQALERATFTPAPTALPTAPADQARQIAQQLALATPGTLPGSTEINLQPEELGRVRMTLTATDGTVTLVIHAERQETSDLLRRHIDQLAQTYRQMGFDTLSFSFAGSSKQDTAPGQMPPSPDTDDPLLSPATLTADHAPPHTSDGRLDLRM